jgi:hypothetical protein
MLTTLEAKIPYPRVAAKFMPSGRADSSSAHNSGAIVSNHTAN